MIGNRMMTGLRMAFQISPSRKAHLAYFAVKPGFRLSPASFVKSQMVIVDFFVIKRFVALRERASIEFLRTVGSGVVTGFNVRSETGLIVGSESAINHWICFFEDAY